MGNEEISINFGNALKECRLDRGLSQEQLALESGLDRTYISMLERNIKTPTITTVVKIAKSLSISPVTLFSKSQENFNKERFRGTEKVTQTEKFRLPFYGTTVSCGFPIDEDHIVEKELSLDETFIKTPEKTFFIKATGESMLPTIKPGDFLIIELSTRFKNNDLVLVQIDSGFSVKRYYKSQKGSIRLLSDNQNFKELSFGENQEVSLRGIVKAVVRSF